MVKFKNLDNVKVEDHAKEVLNTNLRKFKIKLGPS